MSLNHAPAGATSPPGSCATATCAGDPENPRLSPCTDAEIVPYPGPTRKFELGPYSVRRHHQYGVDEAWRELDSGSEAPYKAVMTRTVAVCALAFSVLAMFRPEITAARKKQEAKTE